MPSVRLVELGGTSPVGLMKLFWTSALLGIFSRGTIVHAHSSWAGIAVRLAGISTFNSNIFYTPHGYAFLRTDLSSLARKSALIIEIFLSILSRGIVLSCGIHEGKLAVSTRSRRVRVLSNYVDTKFLPNMGREVKKTTPPIILAVGRISEQKNPLRFQRVTSQVITTASFLWIGDGDFAIRSILESSKIEVTGWVRREEVVEKLSAASILVISSDWEGMPIVAIEALALGIPIVAFHIDSLEEIVLTGETGYLCKSELEMVNAIEKILNSSDEMSYLSKNSKAKFYEKYDIQHLRENWQQIYGIAPNA
jgi:hypothetical protein